MKRLPVIDPKSVDLADPQLPVKILSEYFHLLADGAPEDVESRTAAMLINDAIQTLERSGRISTGMKKAKDNGAKIGRPGTLGRLHARVKGFIAGFSKKSGRKPNGAEIARALRIPQSSAYKIMHDLQKDS